MVMSTKFWINVRNWFNKSNIRLETASTPFVILKNFLEAVLKNLFFALTQK